MKYLPHEVDDLELVTLLQEQDPQDNATWVRRYILLMVVLIMGEDPCLL